MESKQSVLLQHVGQVSKSFAENGGISSPRQAVFRAIHEIVDDMGKSKNPRTDVFGTVECLFRGICRQILLNPCDCKDYGLHQCQLLRDSLPEHASSDIEEQG